MERLFQAGITMGSVRGHVPNVSICQSVCPTDISLQPSRTVSSSRCSSPCLSCTLWHSWRRHCALFRGGWGRLSRYRQQSLRSLALSCVSAKLYTEGKHSKLSRRSLTVISSSLSRPASRKRPAAARASPRGD
ncbi:hypothetical protein FKM82_031192 [Ascaphus truei]